MIDKARVAALLAEIEQKVLAIRQIVKEGIPEAPNARDREFDRDSWALRSAVKRLKDRCV
jgi:hypothetical protein